MNNKILITGAAGFIGHQVACEVNRKFDVYLLVRPGTNPKRLGNLTEKATIIEADLRNIKKLREKINEHEFGAIIHIGAIRNRPHTTAEDYLKANVQATEQLALRAMETQAKFIYFSSVGVFGSVPLQLPAGNKSIKISDNSYHDSKNKSEKLINKYVLYGLKAAIIRHTITYGPGDFGFTYSLIKMIKNRTLLIPNPAPLIHLGSVELLVQAVQKLLDLDFKPGCEYNIGDNHPVKLLELADLISKEIHGKPFSRLRIIPIAWFNLAERFFGMIKCRAWQQRFQLFSKDWYYDVEAASKELNLKNQETLSAIRSTIEWFKKVQKKK